MEVEADELEDKHPATDTGESSRLYTNTLGRSSNFSIGVKQLEQTQAATGKSTERSSRIMEKKNGVLMPLQDIRHRKERHKPFVSADRYFVDSSNKGLRPYLKEHKTHLWGYNTAPVGPGYKPYGYVPTGYPVRTPAAVALI